MNGCTDEGNESRLMCPELRRRVASCMLQFANNCAFCAHRSEKLHTQNQINMNMVMCRLRFCGGHAIGCHQLNAKFLPLADMQCHRKQPEVYKRGAPLFCDTSRF